MFSGGIERDPWYEKDYCGKWFSVNNEDNRIDLSRLSHLTILCPDVNQEFLGRQKP